jgi:hypothetical protein
VSSKDVDHKPYTRRIPEPWCISTPYPTEIAGVKFDNYIMPLVRRNVPNKDEQTQSDSRITPHRRFLAGSVSKH